MKPFLGALVLCLLVLNGALLTEVEIGGQILLPIGLEQNRQFLETVADIFSTLASIAIILSLAVATVQIYQTKNHSKAQAVYAALKDVRDLTAAADMGKRFNLYYALYEQKRLGVWDNEMWGPVKADIRAAFTGEATGEAAKAYWSKNKGNFPSNFQTLIDRLR
jgi:hypothetical protein